MSKQIHENPVIATSIDTPLRLELEFCDEGWNGTYDADDPEDEPLMRFRLLIRPFTPSVSGHNLGQNGRAEAVEFEEVPDASYCTRIKATENLSVLEARAAQLLQEFETAYAGEGPATYRPKRLAQVLSWMDSKGSLTATTQRER